MEDDVLTRIISVEKEIQASLESERSKAREWLEEVRRETEGEFVKAEARIREASQKSLAKARKEATIKAENIVSEAEDEAARLRNLDDETLRGIIMRRLAMILPE